MVGEIAADTGFCPRLLRRGNIERYDPHPLGKRGVRRAGEREPRALDRLRVPLDQHDLRPMAARGGAKTGDADAGTEVDDGSGDPAVERGREQHRLEPGAVMPGRGLDGLDATAEESVHRYRRGRRSLFDRRDRPPAQRSGFFS